MRRAAGAIVKLLQESDFSLVLGGPLFQLFRRAHLTGDGLELLRRRVLIIAGVAWLPLLLLSALSGHAHDEAIGIPFIYDIEAHVRFLVALPILIVAELLVHARIRPVVDQFVERGLVATEDMPKFREAIASTLRIRNSLTGEITIVVLVYTAGLWLTRNQIALDTASWYVIPDGAQTQVTPAGYWYFFVSLPIFQFILLRWYLRFFLWFSFLWRVSRLNLRLIPTHPDKTAGLSFLGRSTNAFVPILVAQGALLAGLLASRIFHAGQELTSFQAQIVAFVAFFVAVVVSPLAVFSLQLVRAKRQGLGDYGRLATRYARAFEAKWMHGRAPKAEKQEEELLGSADIQSLADLEGAYAIVREMRFVPFGWKDVSTLAIATVVPLAPLALTIFSPQELAGQLIKVLF